MAARRIAPILSLLALLALAGSVRADEHQAASTPRGTSDLEVTDGGRVYRVQDGDTLSEIAVRFDVSLDDIARWNPDLDVDHIRPGQPVRILDGLRRVVHTVRSGETLSRIAARYEVRVDELLRWNRGLRRDSVRAGRDLTVFTRIPASRSLSIGAPQRGRLEHGRQLTRSRALYVRRPSRAWGTDETVRWIVEAFEALREDDPRAPRVEVHDLSLRAGGPMRGHHSHESGRDADIAYFQTSCPRGICRFRRIGPEQLDATRQWHLFRRWLEEDRVEAIFVDHRLQRAIYRVARAEGVDRRDLSRWFQFPRASDNRYGVIRHHPRHDDHFHVRFVCHESDADCR